VVCKLSEKAPPQSPYFHSPKETISTQSSELY